MTVLNADPLQWACCPAGAAPFKELDMGAYICDACELMFCSHEVNYYHCELCDMSFCEDCWTERLHEEQDGTEDVCGDCWEQKKENDRINARDAELEERRQN